MTNVYDGIIEFDDGEYQVVRLTKPAVTETIKLKGFCRASGHTVGDKVIVEYFPLPSRVFWVAR